MMSKVLAGLALGRLRPKQVQLAETLTGRFRDVHAYEIGLLLDLIETLEARITELDGKIEAHLVTPPGVPDTYPERAIPGSEPRPGLWQLPPRLRSCRVVVVAAVWLARVSRRAG